MTKSIEHQELGSGESRTPTKITILPPAGPREMAKSAKVGVRRLSMSWTHGRDAVRFMGVTETHASQRPNCARRPRS